MLQGCLEMSFAQVCSAVACSAGRFARQANHQISSICRSANGRSRSSAIPRSGFSPAGPLSGAENVPGQNIVGPPLRPTIPLRRLCPSLALDPPGVAELKLEFLALVPPRASDPVVEL